MVKPGNLFEALRNVPRGSDAAKSRSSQAFLLRIVDSASGSVLRVVDKKGVDIEVDYPGASGVDRELLKAFEAIRWSWDATRVRDDSLADDSGIPLHEHSHLIWMLARTGKVVDGGLNRLEFHAETMELQLVLDQAGADWVRCRFRLRGADSSVVELENLRLPTESHVLSDRSIYAVQPLGMDFQALDLFAERVAQLNEYSTLFFSAFSAVGIKCLNDEVVEGSPLPARATLVFQQGDKNAALQLDVVEVVPGFPRAFARDYDLGRVAFVDQMEGTIRVREVLYGDVLAARTALLRRLKKLSRSAASAEAYLIDGEEGLILGPDLAPTFLREHLAEMLKEFDLFGAEKLKTYHIRHVEPALSVSLGAASIFWKGTQRWISMAKNFRCSMRFSNTESRSTLRWPTAPTRCWMSAIRSMSWPIIRHCADFSCRIHCSTKKPSRWKACGWRLKRLISPRLQSACSHWAI